MSEKYRPYDVLRSERDHSRADSQDIAELRQLVDGVATRRQIHNIVRTEQDARSVARTAVEIGLLLIGTTVSKKRHYPVHAQQHRYHDLRVRQDKQFVPEESKLVEAGSNVDIAILCGLFGSYNDIRQRNARCIPIVGRQEVSNFGWGTDVYKTYREGLTRGEEGHVRPHARPRLINAALDTRNPLTGFIDCVYDDPSFERVPHEIGQYVTPLMRQTVVSIPLIGYLDVSPDIIATHYIDVSDQAIVPPEND